MHLLTRKARSTSLLAVALIALIAAGLSSVMMVPLQSQQRVLAAGSAPLLPGEVRWNGVPQDIFGLGDTYNYESTGFRNNTTIQSEIKAAHVPLIRTFFERVDEQDHTTIIPDSTQIAIAQAVQNSGAQCMANLTQDSNLTTDMTWDLHMVSILSPYCKFFEVMNEPDLSGNWPPEVLQPAYSSFWDSFVPQARAQTPGVYFGGPALASEFGLDNANYMHDWLADAASHNVPPDFVSYHWYMCSGIAQSQCLAQVDQFAPNHGGTVAGYISTDFPGKSIPLGITEWSADPGNPSYANDDTFMSQFEQHALAGLEKNPNLAFATQFDIGAEAGFGTLDMFRIDSGNPYTNTAPAVGSPRPMFYVMQEEIGRESTGVPRYAHVIQIPEENHGYGQIVGDTTDAPYINNTLIPGGALATNYFANVSSSLPNYLIWQYGTDAGLNANCEPGPGCQVSAPSIAENAEANGQTWGGYEENSTANCQNVVDGGTGGLYTVHHDPFPYDTTLADCGTRDVNFSNFAGALGSPTTLPNYVFLGPNLNDEMHNGTILQGDQWLQQEIPAIQNSTACTQSSCLIVVAFDESFDASNEQVMAAMTGPDVPAGTRAATHYDHYALTHTMETALGLPTMRSGDAAAPVMSDMFGSFSGGPPPPAPVVSSFSPTSGNVGQAVTVTGTGFTGATAVKFNGVSASFTVSSDTSISTSVPSGASTGPISVTGPNGTGSSSSNFTVTTPPAAPVVSSFSPTSGAVGVDVTISGSGFTGTTAVAFNGVNAPGFAVNSDAQITVAVPAGATSGPISVTNPQGTGTSSGSFTVTTSGGSTSFTIVQHAAVAASGTVTSQAITVPAGVQQGNLLVINAGEGSNLGTISPPSGWSTAYNVLGAQQPAGSAEFYKVVDSATAGQKSWTVTLSTAHSLTLSFMEINAAHGWQPTVLDQAKSNDQTGSSTTALSTGSTAVTTNSPDFVVANFAIHSGSQTWSALSSGYTQEDTAVDGTGVASMDAYAEPSASGAQSASVTASSAGFSVNGIAAFAAVGGSGGPPPAPTVSSFSPTSGHVGDSVTITGTGFTGASAVAFNGTNASSFTVNSDTQITATVPSGATTGTLSVTTANGTGTSSGSFTVLPPAPTITSFSPTSGPVGTSVVITGTNFTGASAVKFNATAASSFTVNSATQITAIVPSGATTGPISVTTSGGTGTSSSNFTVVPPPVVSSFSPTSGPVGTSVTLSGSGFTGATSVKFNGTAASSFTVVSDSSITTSVPSGATTGTISVAGPGGTGTSSASFTVTSGAGTVSVVQHNAVAASGTVTSLAVTLPTGVAQGDLLIVEAGEGSNLAAIGAPSGWSAAYNALGNNQPVGSATFYDVVTSAQAGQTSWTFTLASAHSFALTILDVHASNGWKATVLDQVTHNDQTSSSTTALSTGTTAATTGSLDFVVADFAIHSGTQSWSGLSSGYTQADTAVDGTGIALMDAYKTVTATGAQSAAATASTAGYSENGIAAFAANP
jgi:hypothetical protein